MVLFESPHQCCGCGACENVCPVNAITMTQDEKGFLYPRITDELCINCGICKSVCAYQNDNVPKQSHTAKVYAAIHKDRDWLYKSSSGGVFAAAAQFVIESGGVVAGCAWNEEMCAEHIIIYDKMDIKKLQGSKYVQSISGKCFKNIEDILISGKTVLFSGTPCQCAGLKGYLKKEYENLICIEVVCHGVPNNRFFKEYVEQLENKYGGRIVDLNFRSKKFGWNILLEITVEKGRKYKKRYLTAAESSYVSYFRKGFFYRDSCYSCRYAQAKRFNDLTIGDFWGIKNFHPEISSNNGVSVIISNTANGDILIEKLSKYLKLTISDYNSAAKYNPQLHRATQNPLDSETLWDMYLNQGMSSLCKNYYKENKKVILKHKIKRLLKDLKNVLVHKR